MRSYPDTVKAVRALREGGIECERAAQILPKLDIQFCDIVVPVISDLEKEAILETGEGGREIVYHYDKSCAIPCTKRARTGNSRAPSSRRWGRPRRHVSAFRRAEAVQHPMAGTTVICDGCATDEALLTITQEDNIGSAMGVEGQPQQGRITLQEFKEKGVYQVERKQGDNFGFIAYKDFVDHPRCLPAGHRSRKFEIYCQYKADILNQAELCAGDEWKPDPTYVTPVEGIETTYADFEDQVRGGSRT